MKKITIDYGHPFERRDIQPGDTVDFGADGLLVFYAEPEAQAMRILQGSHRKAVREAVEFVRAECDRKLSGK